MPRKEKPKNADEPTKQFATALIQALEKRDWSVKKLAEELDATYEHVRKIVRGIGFPSKRTLRDICDLVDLDFDKMNRLAIADRIEKRYGGIPLELAGKNPRFAAFERILPHLSEENYKTLLTVAQAMDRASRG